MFFFGEKFSLNILDLSLLAAINTDEGDVVFISIKILAFNYLKHQGEEKCNSYWHLLLLVSVTWNIN